MNSTALAQGQTYYKLTFADRALTMPGLEPYVFIGAYQDHGGTTRFAFQDTASYVALGSALVNDLSDDDTTRVVLAIGEEIPTAFLSLNEAAEEVAKASIRAASLGFPMLEALDD
jgi:hypothetical protein